MFSSSNSTHLKSVIGISRYIPVASMWVVALHSLFLYLDPPPLCDPPSDWLRLFLSQTFSHIYIYIYPNILNPSCSSYLPTYEDGTDSVF